MATKYDSDRPADMFVVIGGASLKLTGHSDNGSHYEIDSLDTLDELLQALAAALSTAAEEWPAPDPANFRKHSIGRTPN